MCTEWEASASASRKRDFLRHMTQDHERIVVVFFWVLSCITKRYDFYDFFCWLIPSGIVGSGSWGPGKQGARIDHDRLCAWNQQYVGIPNSKLQFC